MLLVSASTDRDADGYFPPIRNAFFSRGIVALSFDKPGWAARAGSWRDYALDDRTEQALAMLA